MKLAIFWCVRVVAEMCNFLVIYLFIVKYKNKSRVDHKMMPLCLGTDHVIVSYKLTILELLSRDKWLNLAPIPL